MELHLRIWPSSYVILDLLNDIIKDVSASLASGPGPEVGMTVFRAFYLFFLCCDACTLRGEARFTTTTSDEHDVVGILHSAWFWSVLGR